MAEYPEQCKSRNCGNYLPESCEGCRYYGLLKDYQLAERQRRSVGHTGAIPRVVKGLSGVKAPVISLEQKKYALLVLAEFDRHEREIKREFIAEKSAVERKARQAF